MILILMQYGMHTLEHIMGYVREESLDGDGRAGTLWSLMEMQRWMPWWHTLWHGLEST